MKTNIKSIEKQIVTVKKIAKITKAMRVIAAMKLKKALTFIADYDICQKINFEIFATLQYLRENQNVLPTPKNIASKSPKLWIIFASDLGLCGSFNTKMFRDLENTLQKKDRLILIGKKAMKYFQKREFTIVQKYLSTDFTKQNIFLLVDFLLAKTTLFSVLNVVFVEFKQHKFLVETQIVPIIPISETFLANVPQQVLSGFLIEGKVDVIYQNTLFIYLTNLLTLYYWSSCASEEKIRQFTMEGASENSQEMINDLKLKYNRLRQEKITREILLVSQDF